MRYGQIRKYDVANGPGIRTSFFVTGCSHMCPGCFNQEFKNFNYGHIWTEIQTKEIINNLNIEVIKGLTILGGEPFQNTKDLIPIVEKIKANSNKNIWIYSGYTYELLINDVNNKKLLSLTDVLVDGLFIKALKNLKLFYRGSSNQRIIDVKKSFEKNKIIDISDKFDKSK